MFGSAARLLAVVVLAVGLVCLPTATTVEAAPKSKKTASKKESVKKKDSKKSSKTASKKNSKRDTKKSSKTASKKDSKKRGKNEEPRASRSRRVRETPAPKRAPIAARDEDEEEEEREPAGPRPANRLVADIPTARVVEIQTALIREGVLTGPASGVYDQATFEAMSTFQSRKGYKPVGVPTAFSLRDLGVKKSSGYGQQTAARVLEETAPR